MSPLPINHPLAAAFRRFADFVVSPAGGLAAVLLAVAVFGCAYTVDQTEQVVLTQFGRPIGAPINAGAESGAGLRFKLPFVQTANRFEKRILEWDGPPGEMTTRDKLYVVVDTFARWRIADPLKYFQSLRDERSALSRLDDIIGSETRNVVARHDLIEIVRSDRDRVPEKDALVAEGSGSVGVLPPIRFGRAALEREILAAAKEKVGIWGIELLDVRVKRINYKPGVIEKIYDRMTSERQQIAERFRSEGAGEAAKIDGRRDKDLKRIQSDAYRRVQEIRGAADAKASEIYAAAYTASPRAADFYAFLKTLDTYEAALGDDATLVLTTDSDLFRLLKEATPPPAAGPRPAR
ncbi:MAG: protease modulator HflC [Planctomycetaceae bacterium]